MKSEHYILYNLDKSDEVYTLILQDYLYFCHCVTCFDEFSFCIKSYFLLNMIVLLLKM